MTVLAAFAASLALAVDMPRVLVPLGLSVPASEPPTIKVSIQLAGNDARKQDLAVTQTAARYGGVVAPAEGKPAGPKYVQIVFPPNSVQAQRGLLDRVINDLGSASAGVISGRAETLTPALEERKAAVAKEAAALAAERSALAGALDSAPETTKLIDSRLSSLGAFDPQREPRRAILLVRLADEASPASEIMMTPPVKKP